MLVLIIIGLAIELAMRPAGNHCIRIVPSASFTCVAKVLNSSEVKVKNGSAEVL